MGRKPKTETDERERERQRESVRRVGKPRAYGTAAALRRAVNTYFDGICRMVPITRMEWTGDFTQKGLPIYEPRPVLDLNGQPLEKLEYIVPPSEAALCLALGISMRTWENYQEKEGFEEYAEVIRQAKLRIVAYLLEQSMVREKGVTGIIFNLSANYGLSEKKELELGRETRKVINADTMTMDEKLALVRRAAAAAAEIETTEDDDGED